MPHLKGDPNFHITSPTANEILGSDLSVYGACSKGTTDIIAHVVAQDGTVYKQSAITAFDTSWEAIFTGVSNGSYGVHARGSQEVLEPQSGNIPVTVQAIPGLIVDTPAGPAPEEAGGPNDPWRGWGCGGSMRRERSPRWRSG